MIPAIKLYRQPFPGFDTLFQTGFTYSNSNHTAAGVGVWKTGRSYTSHADGSGKWYFEGKIGGSNTSFILGLMDTNATGSNFIGAGANGNDCGYQSNNNQYAEGVFSKPGTTNGATMALNTFMLLAVDMTARKAWLRKSDTGLYLGGGDPTTGTSPSFTWSSALTLHAAMSLISPATGILNTGQTSFTNTVPTGYTVWG